MKPIIKVEDVLNDNYTLICGCKADYKLVKRVLKYPDNYGIVEGVLYKMSTPFKGIFDRSCYSLRKEGTIVGRLRFPLIKEKRIMKNINTMASSWPWYGGEVKIKTERRVLSYFLG